MSINIPYPMNHHKTTLFGYRSNLAPSLLARHMRYRMMADAAELLSAGLATLINKPFEGGPCWRQGRN